MFKKKHIHRGGKEEEIAKECTGFLAFREAIKPLFKDNIIFQYCLLNN